MRQRRLLVLLCFIGLTACRGSGGLAPSPTLPQGTDQPSSMGSPTATPAATASTRPRATPPPRTGPPTAQVERDGIIVELWLPEDVATIGERAFAYVRVTNRGALPVEYEGNPCSDSIGAFLDHSASAPAGRSWPGIAGVFKARLLEEGRYGISLFMDVERIDREQHGCADIGMSVFLEPGDMHERSMALDLQGYPGNPIFPGLATALGRFAYGPGDPSEREEALVAEAPIRIEGERTPEYWIVDFVDRALSEPRFAEWLEEQPVESWINTHSTAWPNEEGRYPRDPCYQRATDGALDIGLFRDVDLTVEYGAVTLDLPSGEVLGVRFEGEGGRVFCD